MLPSTGLRMSLGALALVLACAAALAGCDGSGEGRPASETEPVAATPASRSIAVDCEGIETRSGWRRQAIDVGEFGLMAMDLASAHKNRNGDFVAKMGAVVAGHTPITLRVPASARGRVGLIYGDGSRGKRTLSEAPLEVTFMPCSRLDRSGYVGGLLLDTVSEPVILEVQPLGSPTEPLTIPPAKSGGA
jgi:hypothetical protein